MVTDITGVRYQNPDHERDSLEVQWSGRCAFTTGAWVRSLVRELRSCKPHDTAKEEEIKPRNYRSNNQFLQKLNCEGKRRGDGKLTDLNMKTEKAPAVTVCGP